MNRLEGKIALVTGGSRNTGLEIVARLLREGARVFFCGTTEAKEIDLAANAPRRGVGIRRPPKRFLIILRLVTPNDEMAKLQWELDSLEYS